MDGKLAIIGCGSWGENLVWNFCRILGAERVICCDESQQVLNSLIEAYPGLGATTNVDCVWEDSSVAAVAVATPVATHYSLTRRALLAGLHVFVEEPMTTNTDDETTDKNTNSLFR